MMAPPTKKRKYIPLRSKVLFALAFFCFTLPLTSKLYTGHTGQFIVASEKINEEPDNPFRHTVIYILGHGFKGAGGIILNQRPTEVQMNRLPNYLRGRSLNLFWGGPMETDRVSVLVIDPVTGKATYHDLEDMIAKTPDYLDQLERQFRSGIATEYIRFYVGYAVWDPLQLEREVRRKRWLVGDPDWVMVAGQAGSELWETLYKRYRDATRYGSKQSF